MSRDYSGSAPPPPEPLTYVADASLAGLRLDLALARLVPQHSRSRLQGWVRDGRVRIDGESCADVRRKLCGGERVDIQPRPDEEECAGQAEAIPLQVVFEDAHLLVIDKPPGLVVHPGSGNWSGTLLNALLHHVPAAAVLPRAGIVHRLDKDTSGLMVVAKTLEAQTDLVRQLQARTVSREYLALVYGNLVRDGCVDAPIGRDPRHRTRMAVVEGGKPAVTHYRVRQRFSGCTLVECRLETGRTHQIRVHMAHLGHPLVGDTVYAAARLRAQAPQFHRQALHAWRLCLVHPALGETLCWESSLPADLAALLNELASGKRHA